MSKSYFARSMVPFLLLLISSATCWAEVTIDRTVLGKTFEVHGPNCFSTALRVTKLKATFRAVGELEFTTFLNSFCQKVDRPEIGDIGTYHPADYSFVHAYVVASKKTGIDKPGVDYMGKTPVSEKKIEDIDYVSYAGKECRQYAINIADCANIRTFYRCQKPVFADLNEVKTHNDRVAQWDADVTLLLENKLEISVQQTIYKKLILELKELENQVQSILHLDMDLSHKQYFEARLISLRDQLSFVDISIRGQLSSNLYD